MVLESDEEHLSSQMLNINHRSDTSCLWLGFCLRSEFEELTLEWNPRIVVRTWFELSINSLLSHFYWRGSVTVEDPHTKNTTFIKVQPVELFKGLSLTLLMKHHCVPCRGTGAQLPVWRWWGTGLWGSGCGSAVSLAVHCGSQGEARRMTFGSSSSLSAQQNNTTPHPVWAAAAGPRSPMHTSEGQTGSDVITPVYT